MSVTNNNMYKMNDQQTANILNEIIGSESKRRSLSAASNNSGNEVQMLHNLLINGKLCNKRRSLTASSSVNRAKMLNDFLLSR